MPERGDVIASGATLIGETTWLFPALGVFGVIFAQGGSPLPLAAIAVVISLAFLAGRASVYLVEEAHLRGSFQALMGLVVIYLAMSVVATTGAVDLLWGPRLIGGYSSDVVLGLILGAVAAGFLWYRGLRIANDGHPRRRLLRTFRTGVMALAVSFLAEQSFGVDCHATTMLLPFFAITLAGLAFARLPPGGAWTRTVVVVVSGVIGGGIAIGLIGALFGGRGLTLLAAGWHHLISAIGWLLNTFLVPVLEVIFAFIAWLISDVEPGEREPFTLKLPEGGWWRQIETSATLPHSDLLIQLLKYPLLVLLVYLAYRLLLLGYRAYAKRAHTALDTDRESIQGNADAKADLIHLALGLLPDWMFPPKTPAGPSFPNDLPGITEVYVLYFDTLAAAYENGYEFVPSQTPNERRYDLENALPRAPVARITACFNAACFGNIATNLDTVEGLRRELENAVTAG